MRMNIHYGVYNWHLESSEKMFPFVEKQTKRNTDYGLKIKD